MWAKIGSCIGGPHRIVEGDKQVLLGEKMEYEPLCRECYRTLTSHA